MIHDPDKAVREFIAERLRSITVIESDEQEHSLFDLVTTEIANQPVSAEYNRAYVGPGGAIPFPDGFVGGGIEVEGTNDLFEQGTVLHDLGEAQIPVIILFSVEHSAIRDTIIQHIIRMFMNGEDGFLSTSGYADYFDQPIVVYPESFNRDVPLTDIEEGFVDLSVRVVGHTNFVYLARLSEEPAFPRWALKLDGEEYHP